MSRQYTSDKDKKMCGRCGEVANPTGGWEHGWPLHGKITLGFPSQAFSRLCGHKGIAEQEHFDWWRYGHPAMTENQAQLVEFTWREGSAWRLCYNCQEELLVLIGKFFKIDEMSKAQKRTEAVITEADLITQLRRSNQERGYVPPCKDKKEDL